MNNITEYILSFIDSHHPILTAIDAETHQRSDLQPTVGPEVGRLLALLVRLTGARRVLEFGTSLGYSTLCLGEALQATGGKLTSVELREDLCAATRSSVEKAGLSSIIEVLQGDALKVAAELTGPYDLILQDADKALYPQMLERVIGLTRINGLIVADDALFKALDLPEKFSAPVHRYNELVFQDQRLLSTILPIGDGVTVSLKIAG
jgi:predicted O-methyltransferase YrrM